MRFGRRPRLAALCIRPALVLFGVALLLAACGTATGAGAGGEETAAPPATGGAGAPATAGTGVPRRVTPATPVPTATTVSKDGHVCLNRPGTDDFSALPGLGDRPTLPAWGTFRFVRCRIETIRPAGQGEWLVRVEEQVEGATEDIAAAFRRPDERPMSQSCAAYLDGPLDVWAMDTAGQAVLVRVPVDGCGHIQHEVTAALNSAAWHETGRRRLLQTIPQGAIDSGCESAYADMAAWRRREEQEDTRPRQRARSTHLPASAAAVSASTASPTTPTSPADPS